MDTFDQSDKRDFFRRQRRNLIGVSIVTAFYEAADLKFPEINLLGNRIEIDNPEIVTTAITITFIYFLWRYYTACKEVEGISRFLGACHNWAVERSRAYVTRAHVNPNHHKYQSAEVIQGGKVELVFRLRLNNDVGPAPNVTVRERFWVYQIISFVPTSLNTSHFTEYVLPYLVALIAGAELLGIGAIDQLTNLF
ncbi:MAG: hypothetical protein JJ855_18930 [Rhodospirillales bacterium]|nr:hypothetical protein [Rhodospirillales bacterium]